MWSVSHLSLQGGSRYCLKEVSQETELDLKLWLLVNMSLCLASDTFFPWGLPTCVAKVGWTCLCGLGESHPLQPGQLESPLGLPAGALGKGTNCQPVLSSWGNVNRGLSVPVFLLQACIQVEAEASRTQWRRGVPRHAWSPYHPSDSCYLTRWNLLLL